MLERIPAMTVTIEVDGRPTVRLICDGGRDGGPIVPYASIMVGEQAATRDPGYLDDLLVDAASLLVLYASAQKHWPADLRPAPQRAGAPEHGDEQD